MPTPNGRKADIVNSDDLQIIDNADPANPVPAIARLRHVLSAVLSPIALTHATSNVLDGQLGNLFTLTPQENETLTAANFQKSALVFLVVTTTGTTSRTLTFSTGFKPASSTLATGTSDAKTFVVAFLSFGGKLVELFRTAAE